jgi:hypothetical protein
VISRGRYVCDNATTWQHGEKKLLQNKEEELVHLVEEHERLKRQKAGIEVQLKASLSYKKSLDSVFDADPEMMSIVAVQRTVMKHRTMTEWRLQVRLARSKEKLQKFRDVMQLYDELQRRD